MRTKYNLDWMLNLISLVTDCVKEVYPQELRNWPILSRGFNATIYFLDDNYFILTFIEASHSNHSINTLDRVSFIHENHPGAPLSFNNVEQWSDFLFDKMCDGPQDASFLIPFYDSGINRFKDYELFTNDEKKLLHFQITRTIERQFYFLKGVELMKEFYIPPGYQFLKHECTAFLKDHPNYDRNIFIMTRFHENNKQLELLDISIRKVLKANGFNGVRADDKMYMTDNNLWNNVCVYMICSKYGIAVLEDIDVQEFNPNVALEYGFMRGINKRCLLLTETRFKNLRADILGTLRQLFDIFNIAETVEKAIKRWLADIQ